jgi:hypothetical protein
LKIILERVAFAATLFDDDGISLRFMNADPPGNLIDHIRTEDQINTLMGSIRFQGLTPMGTSLKRKVIDQMIMPQVQAGQLKVCGIRS